MRHLVGLTCVLAIAGLAFLPSPAAAGPSSCEEITAAVGQARAKGDLDELARLDSAAKDMRAGCSAKEVICIGRSVALGHLAAAYARSNAGTPPGGLVGILRAGLKLGSPWQLLVAKGDIEMELGRAGDKSAYGAAAESYELAVNDLAEEASCPATESRPRPAQFAELHKKMETAKMLAPTFSLVRTRDNECGGVFVQHVRDFAPTKTTLPIEFVYDSAEFTAKGRDAVSALRECVGKYTWIQLSGHTDHVGSDEYNMTLSKRRLEAVRQVLVGAGYRGTIELRPKGKREPFVVDDATKYTAAQIDQMNRRVELRGANE